MLEDKVAFLLQKYLGNYVRGLSKEALKISVWKGDVELTNMQLRPEALNALKLPVKVKSGFLGSIKLKVPWSRLGQEPVLVYLDRIFLLVEPATKVEGCTDDFVQEAKRSRVREMETKLLGSKPEQEAEENTSWLGSLINTIIGNIKVSITNIHIRYEDAESNPGHPFAAGITLEKLASVTIDDNGNEIFITGGALEHIQKSIALERLAIYFDSDIKPWKIDKPWEELLPSQWSEIFEPGIKAKDSEDGNRCFQQHSYLLHPVRGYAKYTKLGYKDLRSADQPAQKALINLDDVTLSLSQEEYRDILKLAENITAFNRRLKYAHYRPLVGIHEDAKSWWQYACKVLTEEQKKARGHVSWEQVLQYARLRKRYVSRYISCLQADPEQTTIDDDKEIQEIDRELEAEVILQWRMLAHNFVKQISGNDILRKRKPAQKSWSLFGWSAQSGKSNRENETKNLSEEEWQQINQLIGYKEDMESPFFPSQGKLNMLHTLLEVHMRHNASKLTIDGHNITELSSEGLHCFVKLYPETKIFDLKLQSYQLNAPEGLLLESATEDESLKATFSYKPFDRQVDWSLTAKASPCYMTYLKDTVNQITSFFESSSAVSQTVALETAAAVQMTLNQFRRSAQEQLSKALEDRSRFSLNMDIAAPKITIPTEFFPDGSRETKLLIDLGSFTLNTEGAKESESSEESEIYMHFKLGLKDISAFLVDGDYDWKGKSHQKSSTKLLQTEVSARLPVLDECGIIISLQQIRVPHPLYPTTRLAVRLPSLGFHFSPARYHRLMQVAKLFQNGTSDSIRPWDPADFDGYLSALSWKGVGYREAVWQYQYAALAGPFLYILESPNASSSKQRISLGGKQVYNVPAESVGDVEHVLAICDAGQFNSNVAEMVNSLILRCDDENSRGNWQRRLQGAIYRASASSAVSLPDEIPSSEDNVTHELLEVDPTKREKVFLTGVLDELKVTFSSSLHGKQNLKNVLLGDEQCLLEFRALGSKVEFAMREHDMSIGAVLESLEIEDALVGKGRPSCQFLVRSFIKNSNKAIGTRKNSLGSEKQNELRKARNNKQFEGSEYFFETSEGLEDSSEHKFQGSRQPSDMASEFFDAECSLANDKLDSEIPKFRRIPGLLPDLEERERSHVLEQTGYLDSFVKAQVILLDKDSPAYTNIDKQVMLSLATLSFYFNRPTILALLNFVNAINIEDMEENSDEEQTDTLTTVIKQENGEKKTTEESTAMLDRKDSIVKGLLGKGKDRVIFSLLLSMARAQFVLNNENGTQLATLYQDNLHADIKIFPSTFGVKASLGNLKISDNSLDDGHPYYWICDMRDPGGSSFVQLEFISFNSEDDDYQGYDYSLVGELSQVQIVYLNRFIQELVGYFMALTPKDSNNAVKLQDRVTNSEKWFTKSEIEGSPALRLDLSLSKPIIIMPRRTDSNDFLKLDVLHVTVQNTFEWLGGDNNEAGAIHLEIISLLVQDVNLTVGVSGQPGESIIQDVSGLSLMVRRSLRDLWHQIPNIEAAIKIEELKAAMSDKEYKIITECAMTNISERPNNTPLLDNVVETSPGHEIEHEISEILDMESGESSTVDSWVTIKVTVDINFVELSLYTGRSRDAPLATMQISGMWLLYKSSSDEESLVMATLQNFSVTDDREGTVQEFRRAIGKADNIEYAPLHWVHTDSQDSVEQRNNTLLSSFDCNPVTTMLILDVKLSKSSQKISFCIQRPQLLVALDFLLAVAEFFVPSITSISSDDNVENPVDMSGGIILEQPVYCQCHDEVTISPTRPLVADDERYDSFIYDGKGGRLRLVNRHGADLAEPSREALLFIGSGKKLEFKNLIIQNGEYLDSCISLGANSSYSASEDDGVFLLEGTNHLSEGTLLETSSKDPSTSSSQHKNSSLDLVIELQAVGPELTFYSTSKGNEVSTIPSEKLLHAEVDMFSRLILKGDNIELSAKALGLTVEASSGVRVVEPFDTVIKFSKVAGKTNIHVAISDMLTNFSFSILQLCIRLQEDILAFLRTTSRKATVVCSQFNRIWADESISFNEKYAFWRPQAPPGFAVLGDCLTPVDEPPSKGVFALNTSFTKVKRPLHFELVWSSSENNNCSDRQQINMSESDIRETDVSQYSKDNSEQSECRVWMPIPPEGYVALGCVVSRGREEPLLSSSLCVSATLVTPCALKDCVFFSYPQLNYENKKHAFWRVDNSVGSFVPRQSETGHPKWKSYDLRSIVFGYSQEYANPSVQNPAHGSNSKEEVMNLETSEPILSSQRYQNVSQFELVWWNRGKSAKKKLSIWRPIVPPGCFYVGDIAVPGYEPPNVCLALHDFIDGTALRSPLDFQKVGHINKRSGMDSISFWFPQAPPGYVSLGCIASKSTTKPEEINLLRCVRSDLVIGDQFPDNSIWDTTEIKHMREGFSIWTLDNELGTFIVRNGFKRPPKRFGMRLAGQRVSNESDDLVIDAEVRGLSATLFDDFGGLMAPLFNVALTGITFSLHGRLDNLNSTLNLSLMTRSYNEKDGSWEPLIEPVDGFIRYQYDENASGAPSQIRMAFTRDLNINLSVSNVNMLLEALSSWNKLHEVKGSSKTKERNLTTTRKSVLDKETCYIIPQNKLGQDIFLRTFGFDGQPEVNILPPGDVITVKVPVSNSISDTHLMGNMRRSLSKRVAIVISDAELPKHEGIGALQYMVAVRIVAQQLMSGEVQPQVQSARTRCMNAEPDSLAGSVRVRWNEVFYFKVDAVEAHMIEIIVTDVEKGVHIGSYSTPLTRAIFLGHKRSTLPSTKEEPDLAWRQLCSTEARNDENKSRAYRGKIRCGMFISSIFTDEMYAKDLSCGTKPGDIQVSPAREGPWTTVNLNCAASAVCWRKGHDSIAREVSVKGSNKYLIIRSLVSVLNQTDFSIELCLFSESSNSQLEYSNDHCQGHEQQISDNFAQDEVFENEKYHPLLGWGSSCPGHLLPSDPGHWSMRDDSSSQDFPEIQLPPSWKWASDWHIDNTSSSSSEGWAYAFDFRHLNWPPSFNPEGPTTCVRRRRWIRTRQHISNDGRHSFSVGILRAGEVTPLPVECLGRAGRKYILKFKPCNLNGVDEYLWSHVFNYRGRHDSDPKHVSMPCISVPLLMETEELVYTPAKEANATTHRNGLWFCMSVKATVIGKDVHLDPIRDWKLVLTAPLTLISFLPVSSEFSVLEKLSGGELSVRYRGVVKSGETIKVYSADLRNPLYFSLIPQGGWQPIHEAALISHPTKELAQYLTLKNSYSSRMVQVILEHNKDGKDTVAKILRIYTPYWLECLRCPPLQLRLIGMDQMRRLISSINTGNGKILEQINQEELQTGCTIISTFDPKSMGLSITLSDSGNLCFSRTMALSPLSDLDGSVDLKAHDGNGHSIRLFVSTKLCPYQSAPTKVICVRPYMTFTNRTGQCLYIKLHNNDEPKSLHASDWRVAYCMVDTEEREKLQVRLDNTNWSYPFAIKEDTISVVMRQEDGTRQFLRAEIRGYEEGSRFLIVFRLGSNNGPFRIENRTNMKLIKHRQSGLDDDAWQLLKPLSTMNFAWEDPYGQHLLDVLVEHASISSILTVDIDKVGDFYPQDGSVTTGICIRVIEVHDIKVVTFYDDKRNPQKIYTVEENAQAANDVESVFQIQTRTQSSTTPLEIILEVGAVGVSIVDQTPKEILYLYLQRVFVSYSTGYTSRLKLLLENLQLDNQLPLTNMPVLLSPEVPGDVQHPVFKLTFTMSNDNVDGTQVYPYIGIRVTENCWRLNVHEPIIWAVMEFYKNIQLDRFSEGSNVTQVDPEIKIELIDISEIRLKFSLEAAPAQRPHGIFGIWTPIINTIGNVLKMQIHFRTVVCRSKFMRKSSVMPAIINRIRRDLIHNPFHLLFGVDVLGMTSSTLASLSKGFAELSTDGQFLQLRTKQGSTRRITGFGDGILQGTEALAQGVAFGVSGVLTKPWTNAREHGIFGFLQGVGTACLGFIVQPVSGILDFVSLTVHGVGASCTRFFEIFGNKSVSNRIRLPRAIRGNGLLEVYDERAALGQMILHLAEASRHFGCTEIFKEPSKFAWSDFYEEHFDLPRRLILLVTNRRVLMVQCSSSNKMLTRPCKIQWDVPWDELLALELVKGDQEKPAHVLLHLRNFKRSECFVRVIKFLVENDQEGTNQATVIYSFIQRLWNTYQSGKKGCDFKMPNNQRHLASSSQGVSDRISVADSFNVVGSKAETSSQCPDSGISETLNQRPLLRPSSKCNRDGSLRMHTVNFQNIWNSEQDSRSRCTLCPELVGQDKQVCSIWRPICPEGYISIGHIAHIGKHPPTISIVYQYNKREFASPIGFDLVWRNCIDDFIRPLSIWIPKAPEGYRSIGCVAVEGYVEPEPSAIFCVHSTLVEETMFEDEPIWTAPGAYPWACYLYQVQSEALHFVALRQKNEDSTWRPCKIVEDREP